MSTETPTTEHDSRWAQWCALYVMGALESHESTAFEEHVLRCGTCASALTKEARLEMLLDEATATQLPRENRSPRLRRRPLLFAAAALAASVAVALATSSWRGTSRPPPRSGGVELATHSGTWVSCPEPPELMQCLLWARRHGLRVDYPGEAAAIPKYESMSAMATRALEETGGSHAP